MRDGGVNCEALQRAVRDGRELARTEAAHLDGCEACLEAWLTAGLDAKPEVAIPADFAARVAAGLPAREGRRGVAPPPRRWGLITAVVLATVVLGVLGVAGPQNLTGWVGLVFVGLVVSEVAGIALWLGPRGTGR